VGQVVPVKILSVDKGNRKISLSMKAAVAPPEPVSDPDSEDDDDAVVTEAPPKPRTTPLRGGVGHEWKLPGT
jgi:predicted RNA-binding protein with RPS1 domain